MEFQEKIAQVNARLKGERVRVRIGQKGGALNLQATLPPKSTSNRAKPDQQKVYIKKPANLAGLRAAEKLARLLSGQVIADRFTWEERGTKFQASSSCGEEIARFEKHYLNQGGSEDT